MAHIIFTERGDFMKGFKEISIKDIGNVQKLIGDDWMLVTAGNTADGYNTMTASWGCMGVLWNKPVAISYIRPQRHTYMFTESNEYMTLCFFNEDKKDALRFCGTHSGRDCDKAKECGLTPIDVYDGRSVFFEEAKLVILCKKLYASDIKEDCFLDKELLSHYPIKDYHRQYVCEIIKAFDKN